MNEPTPQKTMGQILHETFPIAKEVPWNVLSKANKAQREASAQAVIEAQPAPQVVEPLTEQEFCEVLGVGWLIHSNREELARINKILRLRSKAQPAASVALDPNERFLHVPSQPATEAGGEWEVATAEQAEEAGWTRAESQRRHRNSSPDDWTECGGSEAIGFSHDWLYRRPRNAPAVQSPEEWEEATGEEAQKAGWDRSLCEFLTYDKKLWVSICSDDNGKKFDPLVIYRRPRTAPTPAKVEGGTDTPETNALMKSFTKGNYMDWFQDVLDHARTLERRLRESEANHNDLGIKYLFLEKERDTAQAALSEVHAILDGPECSIVRDAKDGYPEGRESRILTLPERVTALLRMKMDYKKWLEEKEVELAAEQKAHENHLIESRQGQLSLSVLQGELTAARSEVERLISKLKAAEDNIAVRSDWMSTVAGSIHGTSFSTTAISPVLAAIASLKQQAGERDSLKSELARLQWRSVSEGGPKEADGEWVFAMDNQKRVVVAGWNSLLIQRGECHFWMPIPPLPTPVVDERAAFEAFCDKGGILSVFRSEAWKVWQAARAQGGKS